MNTANGYAALVTGAGSGIGRAVALRLAQDGATVIAADLDLDAARAAADEAQALPGRLVPLAVDVADERSVAALFTQADRHVPVLAALVNVAGIGSTTSVPDCSAEDWDRVFAVNARGAFLCSRAALARFLPARAGTIVSVASVAGLIGLRNRAAYCASKGALIALTRAMAIDHVRDGIRVNCVCPGTVHTPWVDRLVHDAGESLDDLRARQPMGRLGTPAEIADAVLYLLDDRAAFVTGSALVIDGGLTAA